MKSIIIDKTVLKNGKTLDQIASDRVAAVVNLAEPASFEEVFGNLSTCRIINPEGGQTVLNLSQLNLNSLKGCPSVVETDFHLDSNPNLINLEFFPREVFGYTSIQKCESLKSLKGVENLSAGIINAFYFVNNPVLSDISDLNGENFFNDPARPTYFTFKNQNLSIQDILLFATAQRKSRGDFNFLTSDYSDEELERAYTLYERVGFDQDKFKRAMSLI